MKIVLMDVDDTLYPKDTGPFLHVTRRIDEYVMSWCGIGPEETGKLRKKYISAYGSTLGGLMRHHGVDPDHYLKAVHDVPVEELLARDERLAGVLSGIPGEMVIFSNGSRDYVRRVLDALGIASCFSDLFTIEFMDYVPKPRTYPFRKVMELYGNSPSDFVLVDDRLPNILKARELGMGSVMVGEGPCLQETLMIPDIYAISQVVS
ncbi:MAG TPA: pyrimidine 5'-nucleotidase [Deltaproteobacteria bacterium]|jgi:putative hydrolase of the HAD superfamily|nr:pyrimidine 5'-nucleotidase [Deltaproteobacteria bacterium]HOI07710.1 pyrimidine 5'-nucleotidase [Deltaproteobacteria bacterium]